MERRRWKKVEDFTAQLGKIISDSLEPQRGPRPIKAIAVLEVFKNAGPEGVTVDDLLPFFEDAPDSARSATMYVATLNQRYLTKNGLKIEGTIVYKVTKYED